MKLITLRLEVERRKILTFQFLTVALRCAELGRTANSARVLGECAAQMREAYDFALMLSIRAVFTTDDCGAFDSGCSYVQDSFLAMRARAEFIRAQLTDIRHDDTQWLKDWEPMWNDPGSLADSAFELRVVRSHLKKLENVMYASSSRAGGRDRGVTGLPPSRVDDCYSLPGHPGSC